MYDTQVVSSDVLDLGQFGDNTFGFIWLWIIIKVFHHRLQFFREINAKGDSLGYLIGRIFSEESILNGVKKRIGHFDLDVCVAET